MFDECICSALCYQMISLYLSDKYSIVNPLGVTLTNYMTHQRCSYYVLFERMAPKVNSPTAHPAYPHKALNEGHGFSLRWAASPS